MAVKKRATLDAKMMHDHRDARRTRAMWAEHCEEQCIAMVGVLGVVEEPRLLPLATANVGFRGQLSDEPAIRHVNGDRFLADVFALNESFVAALGEPPQVVIDVVLVVPIVPVEMAIQRLHRVTTAHHESVSAGDFLGPVNVFAHFLRRMLASVKMLTTEVGESPVGG